MQKDLRKASDLTPDDPAIKKELAKARVIADINRLTKGSVADIMKLVKAVSHIIRLARAFLHCDH